MRVELEHDASDRAYWVAEIVGDFGRMLSLQWLRGKDSFFFDLDEKKRFYPIGFYASQESGHRLAPPPELKLDDAAVQAVQREVSSGDGSSTSSIPLALFAAGGVKPSLFRVDDVMHVSLEGQPESFWFARIQRNVGGRLLLQWLLPPDHPSPSFWLFYSHPRVLVPGDCVADSYKPPVSFDGWQSVRDEQLETKDSDVEGVGHQELLRWMIKSAQKQRPSLLLPSTADHLNETALVFPSNLLKLVPAKIESVIQHKWYKVSAQAGEDQMSFWYPQDDSNCLLPVSWAEVNEIPIDGHPENPTTLTLASNDRIQEFKSNGKIEVVDPRDADSICEAVIIRVTPPLVWTQISSERIRVLPFNSTDMFPAGFAENNGFPLTSHLPQTAAARLARDEAVAVGPKNASSPAEQVPKAWCPRIYFNYKCFTGPSLSKSKLRNLPRFVGPGPVLLVMQEVISKVLSIAYVSSRILNELASDQFIEMLQEHKIVKTQGVEFKARYNNSQKTARMDIPIIRSSEKVEEFCHIICAHLKCCFNLFGPKLYDGDNCPSNCRGLTKSNKVLKRADYYRQQAIAAKQYLAGESEMPNFESLKETAKGSGRGRGRGKRPVESNSNSGASDEEKAVKKPKRKPGRPRKVRPIVEEETQAVSSKNVTPSATRPEEDKNSESKSPTGEKENASDGDQRSAVPSSDDPLTWNVNKVYKFLLHNRCPSFASHFRDHVSTSLPRLRDADPLSQEIDGPALLLLDKETIAASVMTGYTLRFTERDVVNVSQLISRLQRTWHRRFRR